jgi:hypothetical protein
MRSSWEDFIRETEDHFRKLNTQLITNIDHTPTHFNTFITEADKKYVPKGSRKNNNSIMLHLTSPVSLEHAAN